MKILRIVFIFLVFGSYSGFCTSRVDSFQNQLENSALDSNRVDILWKLYRNFKTNNPDSAFVYAEEALEISKVSQYNYGIINSQYYLGMLCYRQSDFNESKQYFKSALKRCEELGQKNKQKYILNALGMICSSQGELEESRNYYNQSLALAIFFNDTSAMATSYNNIGSLYGYKSDYGTAVEYFKKSIELYKAMGDEEEIVTGLLDLGIAESYLGNYKEALIYLFKALEIAVGNNDNDLVTYVNGSIGGIFKAQGDYIKAIYYYEKALSKGKELGDKSFIAEMFDKIGMIHELQEDYSLAIDYYKQALDLRVAIGEKLMIPSSNISLAGAYIKLNNLQEAKNLLTTTLILSAELDQKTSIGISNQLFGEIAFKRKQYDSAIKYFNLALVIHEELGEETNIADDLIALGMVSYEIENFNKSIEYCKRAYAIAKKSGAKESLKKVTALLSKSYASINDFDNAYHFHLEYKQTYDSLFTIESNRSISAMESRYELERKEQHIELQKTQLAKQELEIKQKELWQNILVFGIVAIVGIVMLILINYRKLRKANDEIIKQKEEISYQREALAKHNQKITDSINYAQRIQTAVLPSDEQIAKLLPNYFVLFQPCDIVSGDFYWVSKIRNQTIIAVVDCTGHGVPGAFMSMLGLSLFKEINTKTESLDAASILNELRQKVKTNLRQNMNSTQWDGMDMGFCILDDNNNEIQFAGAHHSMVMIRNKQLELFKGNKQPVSLYLKETDFDTHIIKVKKGDAFYLYTDGYTDQFGGSYNKKFQSSNLNDLLLNIHDKPMVAQKDILYDKYKEWKGTQDQTDDVLVFGFKI